LTRFVVQSIDGARIAAAPYYHLEFDRFFPDDVYQSMLTSMPAVQDFRPMHGRSRGHDLADGTHTRMKIDLFPEYLRHLPPKQRTLWATVGRALCSKEVQSAFVRRLAPGLARRFGPEFATVSMFPTPALTRDIPGYYLPPHTDTHWKGITVQLYLPPDISTTQIGTFLHEVAPDGNLPKAKQVPFAPNTGNAFSVGDDTWHSADPVGPEVKTRDSVLLAYFLDGGLLRQLRNRGKRIGNFLLNELRRAVRS
jgi:hypothetical protein